MEKENFSYAQAVILSTKKNKKMCIKSGKVERLLYFSHRCERMSVECGEFVEEK